MLANIILTVILVAIAGSVIWYLVRARRRGQKCIGCPYCNSCGTNKKGKCS